MWCSTSISVSAHAECMHFCSCLCTAKALLGLLHTLKKAFCVFNLCSHSTHTVPLLQSVSAFMVSNLSFPLCLYRLWLSSSAQLVDKIRTCSACPVFPLYHILFVFLSTTLQGQGVCGCVCVCVCACVCVEYVRL